MEDLIYLVILIAWAIFAFYRQSQKKKAAARAAGDEPVQPMEEHRQRTWEEILFGEEVIEADEKEPAREELPPRWQKATSYEPISLEQMYMNKKAESLEDPRVQQRMEKEKASRAKEEKQKKKAVEKQHPLLSDFDLRKAVIFSEILRRPYD